MSRLVTISISERAYEVLHQFAWGQKSRVISEYIETLEGNPEIPKNPKILEKNRSADDGAAANESKGSTGAETDKGTSKAKKNNVDSRSVLLNELRRAIE